ncbi:MAG: hypothetical protein HY860_01655 [Chlamydiales bacterium]|nr:hypothetical protein [Chlamydiales bacterium]
MKNFQFFLRKRRLVLFITTFALFFIFLFRHSFVGYGTDVLLNIFFPSKSSVHFTFDKVKWRDKQLILHDFSVHIQDTKNSSPIRFYTEQCCIEFEFSFRRFDITPNIRLLHPYIQVESKEDLKNDLHINIIPSLMKISRQLKLEIDDGEICFIKQGQKASTFFSFKQSKEKNTFGTFYVADSLHQLMEPNIEISIASLHSELLAHVLLSDVSVSWIVDMLRLSPLVSYADLQGDGVVNGNAMISYSPKGDMNHFSIKMKVSDLLLQRQMENFIVRLEHAIVETSYPAKDKKGKDKWWNCFQLSTEIAGASAVFHQFSLKDFYGKVQVGLKQAPFLSLKGTIHNGEEEAIFRLKGVPCIDWQHLLSAELLLRNKEHLEDEGIIDFTITQSDQTQLVWMANVHQVNASFLQYMSIFYPLKKIVCHGGSINGLLRGEWGKKDNFSIEADNMSVADMLYRDNNYVAKATSIHLDGRIVYEEKNFFVPFMQVNIDEIMCQNTVFPHLNIDSTQVAIHVIDNEFVDSEINGQIGDANVYIAIANKVRSPKIQCILDSPVSLIYPLFHDAKLLEQISNMPDHAILSLNLEKLATDWSCNGTMEIEKIDHQVEKIDFSGVMDDQIFYPRTGTFTSHIKQAHFEGKKITNAFYQLPIAMIGMNFQLFGEIDVKGVIDSKGCSIHYQTDDFLFHTKEVEVAIKKEYSQQEIAGDLYFPFDTQIFSVTMPIWQARCIFYPQQLQFEKIDGDLCINGEDLYLSNLKGFSKEGIDICGKIYLHFQGVDADYFDLHVTKFKGFASQFVEFASHFPEFPNWNIDINGFIEETKDGLKLQTKLIPLQKDPDWKISFALKEGMLASTSDIEVKNLSFDFDFDSTMEKVSVSELKGQLACLDEKSNPQKVYIPFFSFQHMQYPLIEFDVRIEDEIVDLFRFVGKGYTQSETGHIVIEIDKELSTIGESKWSELICHFSTEWELLLSQVNIELSSNTIQQLKSFLNSYHLVSSNLLKYIPVDTLQVLAQYDQHANKMDIQLTAQAFALHVYRDYSDLHMMIKAADAVCSAMIQKEKNQLTLIDMKGNYQDSYFIAPIGHINCESKQIQIPHIAFHGDISQLSKQTIFPFYSLEQEYITHIDGEMQLDISGKYAWKDLEVFSGISFVTKNEINPGFVVQSIEPIGIHYSSNRWYLTDTKISCFHDLYKDSPLMVSVEQIEVANFYTMDFHTIVVSMPPEFYRSFVQFCDLHESFLDQQSIYHDFLSKNHLEFSFNLSKAEDKIKIDGIASKGFYWIANRIWQIHDSTISYEKNMLKASIGLSIQDKRIGINVDYPISHPMPVELEIFDYSAQEEKILVTLFKEKDRYLIEKIKGKIPGIEIEFIPKYHKYDPIFALTGKIDIDFSKLKDFFPSSLQSKFKELELGKGYEIMGDIVINYHDWKNSYFEGTITGRDFEVIGYAIRNFMVNAKMSMNGIFLKDLRVSDEAGVVWIDEVSVKKEGEQLVIDIPKVEMSDFRPSLMFKRSMKSKKIKPLIITYACLENLKGPLLQLEHIKGTGCFNFINTMKREFTILDIPLELISRLGLDMKLLIPIKGRIDFQIENKKILLKELKDSVSEGKRSHFFLSKKRPSYIDFDGNMQIDIKMQQHVLLKLTQPFTLSIRGSVFQPQFSLK